MIQHNHWKLSEIQKISIKFVAWGLGILLLLLITFFQQTLNYDLLSTIVGGVSLVFGLFLSLLEKKIWRTRIMRLPFLDDFWTPILEGRWVGELVREGKPHNFVLEVRQSFTTITCTTYSSNSSSAAYAAEILYDKQLKKYQLIFYWRGKTTATQANTGDTNIFDGFTVLDIVISNNQVTKLNGSYFTDRQPTQTKGTINLTFEQKTLKNSFD